MCQIIDSLVILELRKGVVGLKFLCYAISLFAPPSFSPATPFGGLGTEEGNSWNEVFPGRYFFALPYSVPPNFSPATPFGGLGAEEGSGWTEVGRD